MQWLFIVIGILWVVIGTAENKKKQQVRKEAEQRAAHKAESAGQTAQTRTAAPQPVLRPTIQPQVRPSVQTQAQAPRPVIVPAQQTRQAAPVQPPRPAAQARQASPSQQRIAQTQMQAAPSSRLTELQHTQRHTLQPSSVSGHAHEETSMTGVTDECPPEAARTVQQQTAPQEGGLPAFTWNANAVLNGLVYAEILGKPKALRG